MFRILLLCFLTLPCISKAGNSTGQLQTLKSITITVEPGGRVFMGPDTIYVADLGPDLRERLWKSWLSTGKMYDRIDINFRGEVLMGIKGATLDAIKDAQNKTLTAVCLQKYKQSYENLSAKQKSKLKRQFPVLFQEFHW